MIESINVLTQLVSLGIESAKIGIKKMLTLVISKDIKIKEAVTKSYKKLYLDESLSSKENT